MYYGYLNMNSSSTVFWSTPDGNKLEVSFVGKYDEANKAEVLSRPGIEFVGVVEKYVGPGRNRGPYHTLESCKDEDTAGVEQLIRKFISSRQNLTKESKGSNNG